MEVYVHYYDTFIGLPKKLKGTGVSCKCRAAAAAAAAIVHRTPRRSAVQRRTNGISINVALIEKHTFGAFRFVFLFFVFAVCGCWFFRCMFALVSVYLCAAHRRTTEQQMLRWNGFVLCESVHSALVH